MVEKLKKWREVEKRYEHVQIDIIGLDFYLITCWDENIQFVCDEEHLRQMYNSLSESNFI